MVKAPKIQLGEAICPLGFLVDSYGEGRVACTPEKRAGLQLEIGEMVTSPSADTCEHGTPRSELESLVGKLINLATVVVEGRAHLEPFYRTLRSKYTIQTRRGAMRVHPSRVRLTGSGETQVATQRDASWWVAALQNDMQLPLAPRLHFASVGDAGCVVTFQDAARGLGTGLGGFAPFVCDSGISKQMLIISEDWPSDLQQSLFHNELSMPAGELFALVCLASSVHHHVGAVSHVIAFSDSDPAARAINYGASGSPQLQALLLWFFEMCPHLQSLAIWLPGKQNTRSDALSRGRRKALAAISEAEDIGWHPHLLPLPPRAFEVLRTIAKLPHGA